MDIGLIMTGIKVGASLLGKDNSKYISQISDIKRKSLAELNEYNEKNLNEKYVNDYKNVIQKTVYEYANLSEENDQALQTLTLRAVQQGVNLAESSAFTDNENNLMAEYQENKQNILNNQATRLESLASNLQASKLNVALSYNDSLSAINKADYEAKARLEEQKSQAIMSSIASFGMKANDKFEAYKGIKGGDTSFKGFTKFLFK